MENFKNILNEITQKTQSHNFTNCFWVHPISVYLKNSFANLSNCKNYDQIDTNLLGGPLIKFCWNRLSGIAMRSILSLQDCLLYSIGLAPTGLSRSINNIEPLPNRSRESGIAMRSSTSFATHLLSSGGFQRSTTLTLLYYSTY